jgi:hypothetical protein
MPLTVKEAKVNPSRSYPTSASVLASHPLPLVTEFASGARLSGRPYSTTKGARRLRARRAVGRPAAFLGSKRVIIP